MISGDIFIACMAKNSIVVGHICGAVLV